MPQRLARGRAGGQERIQRGRCGNFRGVQGFADQQVFGDQGREVEDLVANGNAGAAGLAFGAENANG